MPKVALFILFNHNYEANLDKLDKIYSGRFSNIFYIMPFYSGARQDVIPVYESSFYFQGYLNVAFTKIKGSEYDHFMVIGDDLMLNPKITEDNYQQYFGVDSKTGFIPDFFLLTDSSSKLPDRPFAPFWHHSISALNFNVKREGIESEPYLPGYENAKELLKRHGLDFTAQMPRKFFLRLPFFKFSKKKSELIKNWTAFKLMFYHNLKYILNPPVLKYPLVGSYSDCIILPTSDVSDFAKYCGVFAALDLFVEIAIPTAMGLSVSKIITEKTLNHKGLTLWNKEDVDNVLNSFDNSYENIVNNFPLNTLYIHPVKLSKLRFN